MDHHTMHTPGRIAIILLFLAFGVTLVGLVAARPVAQSTGEPLFGYGLPVQLIAPDGRNSVQLAASIVPLTATLRLYPLTTAQFISYYNSIPTYTWRDELHFDTAGLPAPISWQETITPSDQLHVAPLPNAPSGYYLLTAEYSNGLQGGLLVILSPNMLLLKVSSQGQRAQVAAWSSRLSTQSPLAGASVAIYDQSGSLLAEGQTNAQGLYMTELENVADAQSLIAVGSQAGQVLACGTRYEWGESWWWDYSLAAMPSHKVYLYTDRPIYRPGQTIYYKAIVRNDNDGAYTPFVSQQPVTITLRDARSTVLSTDTALPSSFGSVSGSFILADEVSLGTYQLETTLDGYTYQQAFQVEAYRKPEYAVTLSTTQSYAIVGDTVTLIVAGDYYFGQPVAGAGVQLSLYKRGGYYFETYDQLVWSGNGTTDQNGRWSISFNTSDYTLADATFIFAASVNDSSHQSVSSKLSMPVYANDYSLSLNTDKYGYEPGETITVSLQARDRQDQPVAGAPLTVTVMEWANGGYRPLIHQHVSSNAQGEARATFQISTTGWYELQAEGRDGRGRAVTAQGWFWTYHFGWEWYNPDKQISISADRASYAPGEIAHLLVRSPVTGTALLSLERGQIHASYPVVLSNTISLINVPIEADFAPNIFATLNIFEHKVDPQGGYGWSQSTPEGQMLSGRVELVVPAVEKELQVELVSDQHTYNPRDVVTFTVHVRNQACQPVRAEVSLGLVDEAIYALSADTSGDIYDAFYSQRGNAIHSFDGLRPTRYYYRNWASVPTATPAGTAAPVAPTDETKNDTVRSNFCDTAYWQPAVVSDLNGQAIITLTLPDNLTRWRATVRAVTLDTQVGDATAFITATQALLVRPTLPRFLIQGDAVRLRTIAHNTLSYPMSASLALSATGLVMLGDGCIGTACASRQVQLPAGSQAYTDWSAVASALGKGKVLARADANSPQGQPESDAVELPLEVRPFAITDIDSRAGVLEGGQQITETFYLSVTAIPDTTQLNIDLSSSIALGLLDGLEYLIDYPYGCIEQTMSRVLPNVMVVQAFHNLGLPEERLPQDLNDIINTGLQKIYGYQHDDGTWGWWYDDDSSLYQTAYVVYGLVMTEKAGYLADDKVLTRGISATQRLLDNANDPHTQAYALYVLSVAGHGDLAATQALAAQPDQLDYFAQAALALALYYDGDNAGANALVDKLAAAAQQTSSTAHWLQSDEDGSYNNKAMASTTRATALALEVLAKIRPQSPILPKAALWLMNKRTRNFPYPGFYDQGGVAWRTTQETAYAILALSDYIQVSGEMSPNYTYTVSLNGRLLASGVITSGNALQPIPKLTLGYDDLTRGDNHIRIAASGIGRLYYAAHLRTAHLNTQFVAVKPAGSGISIKRRYEFASADGRLNTQNTTPNVKVGDLITVHLNVEAASEAWYVMIDDPLPAGCEALNERLNTASYTPGQPYWWWYTYGYNRKEVHDDRVTLFVTYLASGQHEYTYLMRASLPGEFSVMPAEAYPMYDPDTWARSASQQLRINMHEVQNPASLEGDFDRNCYVSDFDLWQVTDAWDRRAGEPGYTRLPDLDMDGDVDIADVFQVADNKGKICSLKTVTPTVPALSYPSAQVAPASRAVSAGEVFTLTVTLDEVVAPGAYQFRLALDPALAYIDNIAVPAGYTALGCHAASSTASALGNQAMSHMTCGAFRTRDAAALAGQAAEMTFSLTALADGQASFALSEVQSVHAQEAKLVYLPLLVRQAH